MLNEFEQAILEIAYAEIEGSDKEYVTGEAVWQRAHAAYPDVAPVSVGATIRRFLGMGLVIKDEARSGSRTKLYLATDAGRKNVQEVSANLIER
jgi:hypothetical protein